MEISVNEISTSATSDDGEITINCKVKDETYAIMFSGKAQEQLLLSLLASSPGDPAGPTARRIIPRGLSRFQLGEDVGISFLVTPGIGIHMVLKRPLAKALQDLLKTFDDPSTWDLTGPAKH